MKNKNNNNKTHQQAHTFIYNKQSNKTFCADNSNNGNKKRTVTTRERERMRKKLTRQK